MHACIDCFGSALRLCRFFAIILGFLGSTYILMDEIGGGQETAQQMLPYETKRPYTPVLWRNVTSVPTRACAGPLRQPHRKTCERLPHAKSACVTSEVHSETETVPFFMASSGAHVND
jgi:hypothetical protein